MTGRRPNGHALKPNQRDRAQRELVIDTLLARALRGVLTIPEAAALAEAWREERRVEEKTRRRLADTTRALERHRAAADATIQQLEAQLAQHEQEQAA
jgi:Mn-dependent DtxR family transcriptional regulator